MTSLKWWKKLTARRSLFPEKKKTLKNKDKTKIFINNQKLRGFIASGPILKEILAK